MAYDECPNVKLSYDGIIAVLVLGSRADDRRALEIALLGIEKMTLANQAARRYIKNVIRHR